MNLNYHVYHKRPEDERWLKIASFKHKEDQAMFIEIYSKLRLVYDVASAGPDGVIVWERPAVIRAGERK